MHVAARADKLIEDNDKVVFAFPTGDTYRTPLAIENQAFANNLDDVEYLSNIRFAIRSWFSCFIQEDVHPYVHGPSIEKATVYFQDVDDFLSSLIIAKYQEVQYENTEMRGDLKRLGDEFADLEKRTNTLEQKADTIENKIAAASTRSNN